MTPPDKIPEEPKYIVAAFTLLSVVTIAGMFIPLMDNDSGEYAIVAMRMVQENDFINIVRKSEDYLDKPHLLFWLSAISMKIFGFTAFAYKLPSVLFAMAGIYATARLGTLLYNKQTGLLAALVLGFSQAFILSNHDVRTDALLTGATILAIYKFIQFSYEKKYTSLIAGAFFLALAVGTKGMVAVLVTGTFLLIHLLYHRKGREIFTWQWLSSIIWFFIFLSPFLICYYIQFDAHPEKVIKGATGVSGVRFLLWGQSFERLSGGQGKMVDNSDFFFFFHTLLWAFLPWSLITYYSIFRDLFYLVKNRFRLNQHFQAGLSCSILILLLVFSSSQFKLPHYLNILFPLLSVLTAHTILDALSKSKSKWMGTVLYVIAAIYIAGVILINGWFFPLNTLFTISIAAISVIMLVYIVMKLPVTGLKPVFVVLFTVGFSNLLLNLNFYPKLLGFQGGIPLADFVNKNDIDKKKLRYFISNRSFSFDYYIKTDVPEKSLPELRQMAGSGEMFYIVVDKKWINELIEGGIQFREVVSVPDYHITMLKLAFLNPATRSNTLEKLYLLRVN
jgi:4-amino-4-deoxy-L-arabinose transferase-like glycosyltransferase